MARPSSQIVLSAEGRHELERLARAPRTQSLLLAKALGDTSDDEVWRVLRKFGISLQRRRSWCVSTDPEFAAKAADVVGLYLDPPGNAIVIHHS
jgi:hypothetical protein